LAACGEGSASGIPVGGFSYFLAQDYFEPPELTEFPVSKAITFGFFRINFSSVSTFILPARGLNPSLVIFANVFVEIPRIDVISPRVLSFTGSSTKASLIRLLARDFTSSLAVAPDKGFWGANSKTATDPLVPVPS
jgi:hypothetical protein